MHGFILSLRMPRQTRNHQGEASYDRHGTSTVIRAKRDNGNKVINGSDNPADAMPKAEPNKALEKFITTNTLRVRVEG